MTTNPTRSTSHPLLLQAVEAALREAAKVCDKGASQLRAMPQEEDEKPSAEELAYSCELNARWIRELDARAIAEAVERERPDVMRQALTITAEAVAAQVENLSEPPGCPTPGACSCPGYQNVAAPYTPRDAEITDTILDVAKEAGFVQYRHVAPHPETTSCGFDRDGSHAAGHYVCKCGWPAHPEPLGAAPATAQAGTPITDGAMRQIACFASHPAVEGLEALARDLERRLARSTKEADLMAAAIAGYQQQVARVQEELKDAQRWRTKHSQESDERGAQLVEAERALTALQARVGEMREALITYMRLSLLARSYWDDDKDMRVGKLLIAMSGLSPGYRSDLDKIHALLNEMPPKPAPKQDEIAVHSVNLECDDLPDDIPKGGDANGLTGQHSGTATGTGNVVKGAAHPDNADTPATPPKAADEVDSRSRLRRISAQRGETIPEFTKAAGQENKAGAAPDDAAFKATDSLSRSLPNNAAPAAPTALPKAADGPGAEMPVEPRYFDNDGYLCQQGVRPRFVEKSAYAVLRAYAERVAGENAKLRNGYRNLFAALKDAPGLPLITCTSDELDKWTDLLHGLLIALGVLEATGKPQTMFEALTDAAPKKGGRDG